MSSAFAAMAAVITGRLGQISHKFFPALLAQKCRFTIKLYNGFHHSPALYRECIEIMFLLNPQKTLCKVDFHTFSFVNCSLNHHAVNACLCCECMLSVINRLHMRHWLSKMDINHSGIRSLCLIYSSYN